MIKAVIVDDEIAGVENLASLIGTYAPDVNVVSTQTDALKAMDAIRSHRPDLVFMDVEMPAINGFDVLAQLGDLDFEVVFVTAYEKYALKAIKLSACDYILKPVDINELRAAINKAARSIAAKETGRGINRLLENMRSLDKDRKISLPTMQGMIFVKISDIVRCEADGSYTWFYFANRERLLVTKNLGEYEALLEGEFIRVHHAHLINKLHIAEVKKGNSPTLILSNAVSVPVSQRRREVLQQYLDSLS